MSFQEKALEIIKENYGISYEKVRAIDSSKQGDFRLNLIMDENYVVRINHASAISEERLAQMSRLVDRYRSIGVYAPQYLKNRNGQFGLLLDDKIVYVSEYGKGDIPEQIDWDTYAQQVLPHLGVLASRYTDVDLSEIHSMWSIIDLAPLDVEVDERQENVDMLADRLEKAGEAELAGKVNAFNLANRAKIQEVFRQLPRCVYQGDLNSSNVLLRDGSFYGLIDFNMSGTEVNINCFLSETHPGYELVDGESPETTVEKAVQKQNGLLKSIFESYTMNDLEKQVLENFRNLTLLSQYPNVCLISRLLKEGKRDQALGIVKAILCRPV